MGNRQEHSLVMLQFNLRAGSITNQRQKSGANLKDESSYPKNKVPVHVGRYLIFQYLLQSRIPDPGFIALQDQITSKDVENLCDALTERSTNKTNIYESRKTQNGKKEALLLYNTNLMIYDESRPLKEGDFRYRSDVKAIELFQRIDGGLFQHKSSECYIVAISYHGENTDSTDAEKKICISRRYMNCNQANLENYSVAWSRNMTT